MSRMDLIAVIIVITAALGTAEFLCKRHLPLAPAARNARQTETEERARFGLAVVRVIGEALHLMVLIGVLLVLWGAAGAPLPANVQSAHELPERPQVSIFLDIVPWVAWFGDALVVFVRQIPLWLFILLLILFLPRIYRFFVRLFTLLGLR